MPRKHWRLTLLVGTGKSHTAVTLDSRGIIPEVVTPVPKIDELADTKNILLMVNDHAIVGE